MILDKSRLYLSALSGGADSTALLLLLKEKGYKVEAVHCNFHLRGEESDRDERFCQKLCDDNGVKLHIAHFDTVSYAAMHQESIETAARNLRYNYFFQLVGDLDAAGICVAHNRNDQAETVLMKLIRGAGIHGLSGMKPVTHVEFRGNDVAIYRPLLTKSRQWIEEYLRQRGQGWVDDSTNFEDEATRNKFRLNIIPMIEKINPSAVENIAKAADRLQEVAEIYDSSVDRSKKRITSKDKYLHIDVKALLEEIAPEAVLFEILNPYGFNGPQIEDIIRHISSSREGCESSPTAHGQGKEWTSKSHRALLDRGDIIVGKNDENADFEMRFPEEAQLLVVSGIQDFDSHETVGHDNGYSPQQQLNMSRQRSDPFSSDNAQSAPRRPLRALWHEREQTRQRFSHRPEGVVDGKATANGALRCHGENTLGGGTTSRQQIPDYHGHKGMYGNIVQKKLKLIY